MPKRASPRKKTKKVSSNGRPAKPAKKRRKANQSAQGVTGDDEPGRRQYMREYQNRARAQERDISPIPEIVDIKRRQKCLDDPERFLRTYFPQRFFTPFAPHHHEMISAILHCARHGGAQAIAAPRGDGKTEITKGMIVFALLAGLVMFPVPVAASGVMAERIFSDIKRQFSHNDLLMEDFPEACYPVRCLDGAPQRASGQHVDGAKTQIEWKKTHVRFPLVDNLACAGGAMAFAGLDSALRGMNLEGLRPDLVLIDDPETRESAASEYQIEQRERMLDMDISGLAGPQKSLARVALCTLQNTYCLAAKLTNPAEKPAWDGKRYRMIDKWPDRTDLWEEYIALRKEGQEEGDKNTAKANAFYRKNRKAMDAGAEVSNEHRKPTHVLDDGTQLVESALQFCYNFIADNGIESFSAEFQNDPIATPGPESSGITAAMVQSRVSGYLQGVTPDDTDVVTLGVDVGKYYCHWAKVAWHMNAVGRITDYGVIEVPGRIANEDVKATELAILNALLAFRTELLADERIDFALIDSGDYAPAVYEFVRQVGGNPWAASKGWDRTRYRDGKIGPERVVFDQCHAQHQPRERLWLYNFNADHWKEWVHDRFLTPTHDSDGIVNPGSLALYSSPDDRKRHVSFSHHIVSEELRQEFVVGKGMRRYWHQINRNNHYLDATTMASVAAGCLGVRIVPRADQQLRVRQEVAKRQSSEPAPRRAKTPHGQPYLVTER